jgi:branched-chain amino acid transport system ATP-binding protein
MTDAILDIAGLETYYGRAHILHGVDFTMQRGEVLA